MLPVVSTFRAIICRSSAYDKIEAPPLTAPQGVCAAFVGSTSLPSAGLGDSSDQLWIVTHTLTAHFTRKTCRATRDGADPAAKRHPLEQRIGMLCSPQLVGNRERHQRIISEQRLFVTLV